VTKDGKKTGKEGSWDCAKFKRQLVAVTDAVAFLPLYKDCQVLIQIDHSSGHGAGAEDALNVNSMSGGYGGKQSIPRSVTLRQEDIGPEPAVLKPGDKQHFAYGITQTHRGQIVSQPDPPFDKPDAPRTNSTNAAGKVVEGFEGKAKGTKQILWETGWWRDGMVHHMSEADLNDPAKNKRQRTKHDLATYVLSRRPDFLEEKSDLQQLMQRRGHILMMSVSGWQLGPYQGPLSPPHLSQSSAHYSHS
jgi:hypothetical protein